MKLRFITLLFLLVLVAPCAVLADNTRLERAVEAFQKALTEQIGIEIERVKAITQLLYSDLHIQEMDSSQSREESQQELAWKDRFNFVELNKKIIEVAEKEAKTNSLILEEQLHSEQIRQQILAVEPKVPATLLMFTSPLMKSTRLGILTREIGIRLHTPKYVLEFVSDHKDIINNCVSTLLEKNKKKKGYRLLKLSDDANIDNDLVYRPFNSCGGEFIDEKIIFQYLDGAGIAPVNLSWEKVPETSLESFILWAKEQQDDLRTRVAFSLALFWPMREDERINAVLVSDSSGKIEQDLRSFITNFDECIVSTTLKTLAKNHELLARSFQLIQYSKEKLDDIKSLHFHQYFQIYALFATLEKDADFPPDTQEDGNSTDPRELLETNLKLLRTYLGSRHRDLFTPTILEDSELLPIAENTLGILKDLETSIIASQQNFEAASKDNGGGGSFNPNLGTPSQHYSAVKSNYDFMVEVLAQFNEGTRILDKISTRPALSERIDHFKHTFAPAVRDWLEKNKPKDDGNK